MKIIYTVKGHVVKVSHPDWFLIARLCFHSPGAVAVRTVTSVSRLSVQAFPGACALLLQSGLRVLWTLVLSPSVVAYDC